MESPWPLMPNEGTHQQQLKNQRGVDYVATVMDAGRFPRFEKKGELLSDYTDFNFTDRVRTTVNLDYVTPLSETTKLEVQERTHKIALLMIETMYEEEVTPQN